MNIIPSKQETFDTFLLNASKIHKEAIEEFLRKQDESIYCSVDREQFVLVRMDERTIFSSLARISPFMVLRISSLYWRRLCPLRPAIYADPSSGRSYRSASARKAFSRHFSSPT